MTIYIERKRRWIRPALGGCAVTAVAAAILAALAPPASHAPPPAAAVKPPSVLASPQPQPEAAPLAAAPTEPAAPPKPETKAQTFKRLAGGPPQEQYQAYQMAFECYLIAHERGNRPLLGAVCGDLGLEASGEVSGASLGLIKSAALAGVHGAYAKLAIAEMPGGAFGRLQDSPQTQQLLDQAYKAALKTGDPSVLYRDSLVAERDGDYATALSRYVASRQSGALNRPRPVSYDPANDPRFQELSKAAESRGISADLALKAGLQLAAQAQTQLKTN
jgi:hypothetical protein